LATADPNSFLSPFGIILSRICCTFDLSKADVEAEHGYGVEMYGAAWPGLSCSMGWHDVETCNVKHMPAWWHGAAWFRRGMALHEVIVWNAVQHAVANHYLNCQNMSQIFMAWCSLAWHCTARHGTARYGRAGHGMAGQRLTWHSIVDMFNTGSA
jgi:hypothetical protein